MHGNFLKHVNSLLAAVLMVGSSIFISAFRWHVSVSSEMFFAPAPSIVEHGFLCLEDCARIVRVGGNQTGCAFSPEAAAGRIVHEMSGLPQCTSKACGEGHHCDI